MNHNTNEAYMYASILIVLILLAGMFRHNAYYHTVMLNNRIKAPIIYLLYQKVSLLTQYMVRTTDTGKMINMLANDLNSMEFKIALLFTCLASPIILIGCAILFVYRLGWWALLCILILLCTLPFHILIGKKNGKILA
jgi:ABC-type multidrug transport system fused ATPase/permease subunit